MNPVGLVELRGANKFRIFQAKTLRCAKAPAPTEIKDV